MVSQRDDRRKFLRNVLGLSFGGAVLPARAIEVACSLTHQDDTGPFYVDNAPLRSVIAGPDEPGQRTIVSGRVLAEGCSTPLSGVLLDIWHADASGNYHDAREQYRLRGRLLTGADGRYSFSSIKPPPYGPWLAELFGYYRPAHYHIRLNLAGYSPLTTQLYFKGDPNLGSNDLCSPRQGCHSDDPQRIIELLPSEQGGQSVLAASYDFVLRRS